MCLSGKYFIDENMKFSSIQKKLTYIYLVSGTKSGKLNKVIIKNITKYSIHNIHIIHISSILCKK